MTPHTTRSHAIYPLILTLAATLGASGCAWLDTNVQRGYEEKGHWDDDQPRVYTTADIRMVMRRRHPETNQEVICTEPTPDVAKALSTASSLNFKGSSNAGASGEVGLSGGSAEAIAELAGRSTALIALRDGLYRTCEAYGNGAIGSDAYALVLSRYGQLMTTLFLGEDIRGAAALGNTTPVQSPSLITITPSTGIQVQKSDPGAGQKADGNNGGGGGGGGGNAGAQKSATRVSSAPSFLHVINSDGKTPSPVNPSATPDTSQPNPDAAPQDNGQKPAPAPPNPNPNPPPQDNSPPSPSTSSTPAQPSAVAAVSLVRMNEDYFDLDTNFMQQLLVACINEYDPTRVRQRIWDAKTTPEAQLQLLLDQARDEVKKLTDAQDGITNTQTQLQEKAKHLLATEQQLQQDLTALRTGIHSGQKKASGSALDSDTEAASAALTGPYSLIQSVARGENPFLRQVCSSVGDANKLAAAEKTLLPTLIEAGHPASSVEPDLGFGIAAPATQPTPQSPTPPMKQKKAARQKAAPQKAQHASQPSSSAGSLPGAT